MHVFLLNKTLMREISHLNFFKCDHSSNNLVKKAMGIRLDECYMSEYVLSTRPAAFGS